jgi:glycosyltransferase involved in cell wall biosynthesis
MEIQPYVVTVDPDAATYPLRDETLLREVDPRIQIFHTNTIEPLDIYKRLSGKTQVPFGGFANSEDQRVSLGQKLARFIRGNFFLPDARIGWNRFAYRMCEELIRNQKFEAVITTSPPHSTQLIGLKLKQRFGLPWIADMRDPWTDIYYYNKLYLTTFSKARDIRMEKRVLENADSVVVVSDGVRSLLADKLPSVDTKKIHIISNGFDEADFPVHRHHEQQENFIISYTGTLSDDYRIDALTNALPEILKVNPSVKLHMTGSISATIHKRITSIAGDRVIWKSQVSHSEAIQQMLNASLLLLVIPDVKENKGILTGKLFEYLAAKRPILCIGPVDGDAAAIIQQCESGITINYDDSRAAHQFLNHQVNEWLKTLNLIVGNDQVKHYSRLHQAQQFLELIAAGGNKLKTIKSL